MNKTTLAGGCALTLLAINPAYAVPVNFQGSLIEAIPCTISQGQLIELDFGDGVIIRNLDGQNYQKTINYVLECSAPGSVRLSVLGTPTLFDGAAVQTDVTGLGIRINRGAQPFKLNTPVTIDLANPPVLTAVPVADPASPPSPGAFHAGATLLADYQ